MSLKNIVNVSNKCFYLGQYISAPSSGLICACVFVSVCVCVMCVCVLCTWRACMSVDVCFPLLPPSSSLTAMECVCAVSFNSRVRAATTWERRWNWIHWGTATPYASVSRWVGESMYLCFVDRSWTEVQTAAKLEWFVKSSLQNSDFCYW